MTPKQRITLVTANGDLIEIEGDQVDSPTLTVRTERRRRWRNEEAIELLTGRLDGVDARRDEMVDTWPELKSE
jgi:hypothetical protein